MDNEHKFVRVVPTAQKLEDLAHDAIGYYYFLFTRLDPGIKSPGGFLLCFAGDVSLRYACCQNKKSHYGDRSDQDLSQTMPLIKFLP